MANYNLDLFLFIHAPSTYTLMTISNPLGRLRFVNSTETLPMLLLLSLLAPNPSSYEPG